MKFFKTFHKPVYKVSATTDQDIIEVGDDVHLVLRDNTETVVQAATVEKGGRRIGWEITGNPVNYTGTSSQNATTAASDDTTGDALANALKVSYNKAQADIATLFANNEDLGAPVSVQEATADASSDGTRLALANSLKAKMNTLRTDIDELYAKYAELGDPTFNAAIATPDGSNDGTTQTLLNALQTAYNKAQTDIQEGLDSLETGGYYQPRSEDVIAVGGENQFACPAEDDGEYASLHDGPEDDGAWEHVVNPAGAPSRSPATLRETARKPAALTGKKAERHAEVHAHRKEVKASKKAAKKEAPKKAKSKKARK